MRDIKSKGNVITIKVTIEELETLGDAMATYVENQEYEGTVNDDHYIMKQEIETILEENEEK